MAKIYNESSELIQRIPTVETAAYYLRSLLQHCTLEDQAMILEKMYDDLDPKVQEDVSDRILNKPSPVI